VLEQLLADLLRILVVQNGGSADVLSGFLRLATSLGEQQKTIKEWMI